MESAKTKFQFQEPVVVRLSDHEQITGEMTSENLAIAIMAFHRDGLVVIENCVNTEHCDMLNEIMSAEVDALIKNPKTHFNDNKAAPPEERSGNMQQRPPLEPALMYEDIWANKAAAAVLNIILGPKPRCNFVDGNTALANEYSGRQRVHADLAYNFPRFPTTVCANYYLQDVSRENGSTEVWLGSAKDTTFHDHLACRELRPGDDPHAPRQINLKDPKEEAVLTGHGVRDEPLAKRRAWAPPIQPTVKKGSVMLRDLRMWHAGIANPSSSPRIMLAFIHTASWYQCPTKVFLPESTRELITKWSTREQNPIDFQAFYLPTEGDCKGQDFAVDFSSRNAGYWRILAGDGLIPGYTFSAE